MRLCASLLSRGPGALRACLPLCEAHVQRPAPTPPGPTPEGQPSVSISSSSPPSPPSPPELSELVRLLRARLPHSSPGAPPDSTPAVGAVPRASLEAHLRRTSPTREDTADHTRALWDAASTLYYRPGPAVDRIVPFDWTAAVSAVAATLPYEGVPELIFVRRLAGQCAGLPRTAAGLAAVLGHRGVDSLAAWVHVHFPAHVLITRAASTGETLYHSRAQNSFLPRVPAAMAAAQALPTAPLAPEAARAGAEAAAVQHALHLLGRGKALPVWTDVTHLAPLLPADVCPAAGGWAGFLLQPHMAELFEVTGSVGVRYVGEPVRTHVFVDGTTVAADAAAAWLRRLQGSAAVSTSNSAVDVRVLVRAEVASAQTHPDPTGAHALGGAERVVVERLLDPQHVLGALISNLAAHAAPPAPRDGPPAAHDGHGQRGVETGGDAVCPQTVHVLCGEDSVEAMVSALRDVVRAELVVLVHTPSREGVRVERVVD